MTSFAPRICSSVSQTSPAGGAAAGSLGPTAAGRERRGASRTAAPTARFMASQRPTAASSSTTATRSAYRSSAFSSSTWRAVRSASKRSSSETAPSRYWNRTRSRASRARSRSAACIRATRSFAACERRPRGVHVRGRAGLGPGQGDARARSLALGPRDLALLLRKDRQLERAAERERRRLDRAGVGPLPRVTGREGHVGQPLAPGQIERRFGPFEVRLRARARRAAPPRPRASDAGSAPRAIPTGRRPRGFPRATTPSRLRPPSHTPSSERARATSATAAVTSCCASSVAASTRSPVHAARRSEPVPLVDEIERAPEALGDFAADALGRLRRAARRRTRGPSPGAGSGGRRPGWTAPTRAPPSPRRSSKSASPRRIPRSIPGRCRRRRSRSRSSARPEPAPKSSGARRRRPTG